MLPKKRQFIKFAVVGGSGVIVNMGVLQIFFAGLHIDYRIASLIAIECAIINNFFWNLRWTFKDRDSHKQHPLIFLFFKFNLSSGLVALSVNWTLLILGAELFHLPVLIANFIGIALGTAANFLISHFWTFSHHTHPVNSIIDPDKITAK